jgi:CBS domain-containing protein
MTTVRDILKTKGSQVWSISPDTSVLEALEFMAEKNVGAVVVLVKGKLVGIISERDFARAIARLGRCLIEAPVKDFMTKEVYTTKPEVLTEECMSLMSEKKIRHLPVMVEGKLVGLISIGDIVKEVISNKESTIHSLENYIEGTDYNR